MDSDYLEPKTFREAWDYNDPEVQKRWSRRTLDFETAFLEGNLEEDFFYEVDARL